MTEQAAARLVLVVRPEHAGQRADKVLVALLEEAGQAVTRAEAQRWMAAGQVLLDGAPIRRARPLPVGASLTVCPMAPPTSAVIPDPSVQFTVVHEDEHLLVVDKPAGLVVHPARGNWTGTLVAGLLARQDRASLSPADPRDEAGHLRPGIVHRLDKGTSGLLVVAKTSQAREALKAAFGRHDVERCYSAIVVGDAARARYDTPYGRSAVSRLRFTSRLPADKPARRRAVTRIEPVERLGGATLVECRLETGRTHQIRVHLAEQSGTPVLGDPLYGRPIADPWLAAIAANLGHQALHAGLLGFTHPATGSHVRWESPLPEDMRAALEALRERLTRASKARGPAT
jgi:23S rRNA pseudouridine1911/1915/1917 synthase